jgi:hypothetical protein
MPTPNPCKHPPTRHFCGKVWNTDRQRHEHYLMCNDCGESVLGWYEHPQFGFLTPVLFTLGKGGLTIIDPKEAA